MRLNNWQSNLGALITERMAMPFAWGGQDCVLFAADVKVAVTGFDPAAAARGTYSDERGALRVMKANGGLEGLGDKFLGERIHPGLAQMADVGLTLNAGRHCFAVCLGERWVVPGQDGLVWVEPQAIEIAWRLEPSNQG